MSINELRFLHADSASVLAAVEFADVPFIFLEAFFEDEHQFSIFTILT